MSATDALVDKRFIKALFHQGNAGNAKHAATLSFDKYVAWNFEYVFQCATFNCVHNFLIFKCYILPPLN